MQLCERGARIGWVNANATLAGVYRADFLSMQHIVHLGEEYDVTAVYRRHVLVVRRHSAGERREHVCDKLQ